MSQYIKDDNIIRVSESSTLAVSEHLPLGTYVLEFNKQTDEFYLKKIDDFKPLGKVYGEYSRTVERILNTFVTREGRNLGVLLSGIKGSGKTLTTKMISVELAKRFGYATIIVNKGYNTAALAAFLHSVDVPCLVIFDEFDKVYSWKESDSASQSGLLDILDGVFESRKLFMMSCNDLRYINPYFFSRPGRIFYHFRYGALREDVISQYCDDNLKNPQWKPEVLKLATFVSNMTFDILKAIVEETNRYDESPRRFIEILNVRYGLEGVYDVDIYLSSSGRKIKSLKKENFAFGGRSLSIFLPRNDETLPLTKLPRTFFREDDDDDEVYGYYTPELSDLTAVHRDGSMELSILDGALRAQLTRSRTETLDYARLVEKM